MTNVQDILKLWQDLHNLIGPVSDVIGALYVLACAVSLLVTGVAKLWAPAGKVLPWLTSVSLDLSKARDWLDKRRALKAAAASAAKAAVVALFLAASAYSATACQATFEESRPRAPVASASIAGVSVTGQKLLVPGSPECLKLSEQETTWKGIAIAGGVLGTSGTVGALIDLGVRDEAKAEVYIMLAIGGALDAAAAFAANQAAGYGRDYVALGCAGTPAP